MAKPSILSLAVDAGGMNCSVLRWRESGIPKAVLRIYGVALRLVLIKKTNTL